MKEKPFKDVNKSRTVISNNFCVRTGYTPSNILDRSKSNVIEISERLDVKKARHIENALNRIKLF